jgi:YesN/AraC family two-component response regulator
MAYTVMVVDDELLMRQYLQKNLPYIAPSWVVTCTAEDGVQAVEHLCRQTFDLVITDIRMPDMDGLELAKYIHQKAPNTQVVVISGYDEFEYACQALRSGVCDYLLKPLNDHKIAEALERIAENLRGGATSDQTQPAEPESGHRLVKKAVEYIHAHYSEPISLEIIADILGITPNYLSELFHKNTGESYSKYVTRVRMERAVALMRACPDMKIYQIAERIGYTTNKHFSTAFKRHFNCTPGEYAARLI